MLEFRKRSVPLPFLDRKMPNDKYETAHLSCITVANWPGILSSARVVFRLGGIAAVYPDDFTAFLVHDLITTTSQRAVDAQHALAFTDASMESLQKQVRQFYAERSASLAISA